MKKSRFILTTASLVSLSLVTLLTVFLSLAWFSHYAKVDSKSEGEALASYFAYGNGIAPDGDDDKTTGPYGISSPRHLYNLAWLQYLGYFNKKESSQVKTVYFELARDIDMKGWTLPPIGTSKYEFVGNFNGKGCKISNLTISNDRSDYPQTPAGITASDFGSDTTVTNIVGFFGVVGKYTGSSLGTYDSSTNQIQNVGLEKLTVKSVANKTLVGLAAGYVNGTLSGVAVNNSEIDLSGSAGNYISASMTENLSDYSLIGYAADTKYLNQLQDTETTYDVPQVSNPYLDQGGDKWGGSIDMKTMYSNLKAKVNDTTNRLSTVLTDEDIDYTEEERTLPTQTYTPITSKNHLRSSSATPSNYYKGYSHYYYKDFGTKLDGSTKVQTASYSFSDDLSDGYIGLSGRYTFDSYTKYTKQITHEGTKNTITISSGSHYLKAEGSSSNGFNASQNTYTTSNSGTISDTTTASNATNWLWDDTSKTLATSIDSLVYYLYNNSGTLVLSTTPRSSAWTWYSSANAFKSGNYYLIFDGSDWRLSTSTSITSYSIRSGSNYLSYTTDDYGNISITSTSSSQTSWYFDSSNYVYTIIDRTKYYLYADSNNDWSVSLTSNSSASYRYQRSGNYIRYQYYQYGYRYYYYLSYSSSDGWSETSTQTTLTITAIQSTPYTTSYQSSTADWDTSTSKSESKVVTTYPTYFPLTWEEGDTTKPSGKNTGYLLGGEYFDASGNDGETLGDVRLAGDNNSDYTTSRMTGAMVSGSTYSKANFFAYSFDSSGNLVKIGDPVNNKESASGYTSYADLGLKKYYLSLLNQSSGARPALDNMLSNGIAYGLHFMNADISMDHIITAPYALINGVEYENYQLPEDAIDFHLKSAGRIDFFAHTMFVNTYNSGNVIWNNSNNSFFSLHRIIRNGSKIIGIKQIAKIYRNADYGEGNEGVPEYVYTYRNSSDNENTSDYDTGVYDNSGNIIQGSLGEEVFDTYWLTDPEYSKFKTRACYYFEIPVNQGEFALGSVSGKTKTSPGWPSSYSKNGAYLMYLDIGASKKNNTGIVITERSTTTTKSYLFPKGVDFRDDITSLASAAFAAIQGGESSAIVLTTADKMNIQYTYTAKVGDSDALLTVGPENGTGSFVASYKRADTEVKDRSGKEIPAIEPTATSIDRMERESTYDLTKAESEKNKLSVVEVHKDGEGNEISRKSWNEDVTWSEEEIGKMINVGLNGQVLFTVCYDAPVGKPITLETKFDPVSNTVTLNFVSAEGGEKINVTFTALKLTQTVSSADSTTEIKYALVIQNNGVSSGTAYGNVTTELLNKSIPLVADKKSS